MTTAWSVDTQGLFLCLKTDLFFRFALSFIRIRWKRSSKTELFINALQSGDFWKRRVFVYSRADGRNSVVFEYDVMTSCTLSILLVWRMFRKGCYSISIVLTFSRGQTKTIPVRYIWICISKYVDEASVFTKQGESISVNFVCNRGSFCDVISAILVPQTNNNNANIYTG